MFRGRRCRCATREQSKENQRYGALEHRTAPPTQSIVKATWFVQFVCAAPAAATNALRLTEVGELQRMSGCALPVTVTPGPLNVPLDKSPRYTPYPVLRVMLGGSVD